MCITALLLFLISFSMEAREPVNANYQQELIAHFDAKGIDIRTYFEDERFQLISDIRDKFTRAVEVKIESFEDYQQVINYDKKRKAAADFIREHAETLNDAEKKYGISKEVIVGILGVESEYGTYAGKYNPFSAYVSMYAMNYRSKFALAQLEELFLFAGKHNLHVLELKSSYAGAISYAQFLPWSLNRWFVGGDVYDMKNNIYSVANYLAHYKEVTGSLEKAVLRYNNSTLYRKAVLTLAEDARSHTGR
jgi:membrane-bound lytic murein transglycosylase B